MTLAPLDSTRDVIRKHIIILFGDYLISPRPRATDADFHRTHSYYIALPESGSLGKRTCTKTKQLYENVDPLSMSVVFDQNAVPFKRVRTLQSCWKAVVKIASV